MAVAGYVSTLVNPCLFFFSLLFLLMCNTGDVTIVSWVFPSSAESGFFAELIKKFPIGENFSVFFPNSSVVLTRLDGERLDYGRVIIL